MPVITIALDFDIHSLCLQCYVFITRASQSQMESKGWFIHFLMWARTPWTKHSASMHLYNLSNWMKWAMITCYCSLTISGWIGWDCDQFCICASSYLLFLKWSFLESQIWMSLLYLLCDFSYLSLHVDSWIFSQW